MTADTTTSRPLRKDAARNRALLVQAAREVFAERGLDASLDDIARHAGLGVGTAYRHFANKHELARAILAEAIEQIVASAERAAAADDPWAGLVSFLESIVAAQSADRGLREVLLGVHDADQFRRIDERLRTPMARIVQRARDAGELRPDVETSDLGVVIVMLCSVVEVTGDVASDLWQRYLALLLDALRTRSKLPVPALDDDVLSSALRTHKQRVARFSAPTD
jgi:AcrR family transcriptional regulator